MALTSVSDAACALLPLAFIVRVKVPLLEKIVLVFIMGLGLLASAIGTAKIFSVKAIDTTTDPAWQTVHCDVLRYLEQNIGILAANLPLTKALLQKSFGRLGGRVSQLIAKAERPDSCPESASSEGARLDIEAANGNEIPVLSDVSGLAEKR